MRAVDCAGNSGATTSVPVNIDTTGPVVYDDDPGDWVQSPLTVNLWAIDGGCGIVDHVEQAPTHDGPWQTGSWFTVVNRRHKLGSGERTRWVRAVDGLGNVTEPQPVIVRVDIRPPVTTDDADAVAHGADVIVHLTATDAHSGPWHTYYSIDGGGWKSGTTARVLALPGGIGDGAHRVDYYSVDAAGNVEAVKTCWVVIDT